jgi:hypothetical protein
MEIRRTVVPHQPRQKSFRDPISTNSWVQLYVPTISAKAGSVKQENHSKGLPEQKVRPLMSKITTAKRTGVWLKW